MGRIASSTDSTEALRNASREASTFEKRSRLLEMTRQHYVALLKQVLVDGKLPRWNDLDPGGADATTRNY